VQVKANLNGSIKGDPLPSSFRKNLGDRKITPQKVKISEPCATEEPINREDTPDYNVPYQNFI